MIAIKNLSVSYSAGLMKKKRRSILEDVSFDIQDGETLALIGESGCGKSTLAKAVLRLIPCDSGDVRLNGVNLSQLRRGPLRVYRKDMQIIFQNPESALNPRMRIYDSIAEMLRIHRLCAPRGQDERARVMALTEMVGLGAEHLRRYPHELSGGQVQRAVLARILSVRPKFLIADEPTSMLDVSVQAQILSLLRRTQAKNRHACLFISHDLDVVRIISDRIVVLHEGRIVETGVTDRVLDNPQHEYTSSLIRQFSQGYVEG
ncbi:MAG: ABC transporter ATP-binding protein [Treponema sp.]|jgi:ABC-type glutathione transport system ATPase component|nr:ABC transporter ATP-binding protein [Treponema sp.]